MTNKPLCSICRGTTRIYQAGTTDGRTYFSRSESYGIAGGDYRSRLPIIVCEQCGHGATQHGVEAAFISAWYQRHELDTVFLTDENGRRRTARQVLERISTLVPQRGRLLDIGSGPGLFLTEAKQAGWQVDGIEPSAASRAFAAQQWTITIRAGDVEVLSALPDASYDVVTLFDVIEHVADPAATLAAVARLLKPEGLLVLTTPRFDSVVARLLGRRWYALFPAHLHYFTRRSLRIVLKKTGFTPETWRLHVRHLSVGYLWQRLRGWLGGGSGPATSTVGLAKIIMPVVLGDEFEVYARRTK